MNDNIIDLDLDWSALEDKKEEETVYFESVSEGLFHCLNQKGYVDIEYIANITLNSKDEVIEKLKGSIYQDPLTWNENAYFGYKMSDDYLSGNLLQKLKIVREANLKYNNRFKENEEVLLKMLPKGVSESEIYYNLASPWIKDDDKRKFFVYLTGISYDNSFRYLIHDEFTSLWEVKNSLYMTSCDIKYSTKRMRFAKLFEHTLNSKTLSIVDFFKVAGKSFSKINKEETILIEEKQKQLENEFKEYVENHDDIKKSIIDTYNEKYGYIVPRIYNGDFLDFTGMNKDVHLYQYQKNAIARIIFNPNTLLAHNVGTGKTYIMIAAGEELFKMKKTRKNIYVVPNNLVSEWKKSYNFLYPNRELLVLTSNDFAPKKYRKTLEKMRLDNSQVVIIPYSCLDRIPLSKQIKLKNLRQELDDINKTIDNSEDISSHLYSKRKEVEMDIAKLDMEEEQNADITFDKLGFTRLFLDEAHNYKNIPIITSISRVKGINTEGSAKCRHMLDIVDYINSNLDSGVIMATGTPITNSITDCYTIQRYLQSGELKLYDIKRFDDWVSMFSSKEESLEVDLDSENYRTTTRFSKFYNLPELTKILSSVSDFYYDNDGIELPKFKGYTDIVLDMYSSFKDYMKSLSKRIDEIREGNVDLKQDNLLKVTTDGRKAALDLRLVDLEKYAANVSPKLLNCAMQVSRIYNETEAFRGTQIIFCDESTPKDGFNLYDELKRMLVDFGVKETDIEYIHNANTEAKREYLYQEMRLGHIRVLIGSTLKLGLGVNVQNKLYAIHHLDVPWRPCDMIQREGRILRQGNENEYIYIFRYIAKSSFDAYSWQLLEIKQRFINELLSNSISVRSAEDVLDVALSYAEVKALAISNPLIKEHFEKKNKLQKLRLLQKKVIDNKAFYERELLELPQRIQRQKEYAQNVYFDMLNVRESPFTNKEEKEAFRKKLYRDLNYYLHKEEEFNYGSYRGFDIILPANQIPETIYLILRGKNSYQVLVLGNELAIINKMDSIIDNLKTTYEKAISERINLEIKETTYKEEITKIKDYTDEIYLLHKEIEKIEERLGIDE